jgi:3-hydroxy-9,10-secoandrosta-1,3,5(10)-triene-9,17-dione monooxygenase reductase component
VTIDAKQFRTVLGQLATGVTIVTLRDAAGVDQGMTVSAFTSLSLSPPLVLACIDRDATLAPALADATHLGVSVLASSQREISQRFAESGVDRFAGVAIRRGASGVPLIEGALAQIEGRIVAQHPGGDHTIVVCEVTDGQVSPGEPLLYHRAAYTSLRS